MTPRTRLVATLAAGLDPERYSVAGTWATPDALEPGRLAVRCWAAELSPGPTIGALTFGMTLWVVTPAAAVHLVDDVLDDALMDLLAVLHPLEWCRWSSATRGVLEDVWHGYRFELTAGALVSLDDDDTTTTDGAGDQPAAGPTTTEE